MLMSSENVTNKGMSMSAMTSKLGVNVSPVAMLQDGGRLSTVGIVTPVNGR